MHTKEKLTVSIDISLINAIEDLKNKTRYANRSNVTNDLLRDGLAARGIILGA